MPPALDVYALTSRRNRETIDAFLAQYVDVEASRDRGDEELMALPQNYNGGEEVLDEDWDWIPVSTLEDVLAVGLSQPPRAFTVYLRPKSLDHTHAMLCFTRDQGMIVGVSVDDPQGSDERRAEAEAVMLALMRLVSASHGWVVGEMPPPLDPHRDRPWDEPFTLAASMA